MIHLSARNWSTELDQYDLPTDLVRMLRLLIVADKQGKATPIVDDHVQELVAQYIPDGIRFNGLNLKVEVSEYREEDGEVSRFVLKCDAEQFRDCGCQDIADFQASEEREQGVSVSAIIAFSILVLAELSSFPGIAPNEMTWFLIVISLPFAVRGLYVSYRNRRGGTKPSISC